MTRGRVFYGWWVTITFAVMGVPLDRRPLLGRRLPFASIQLVAAAAVSLAIDEGARCSPRLRAVVAQR
jgi:hypothetical protein